MQSRICQHSSSRASPSTPTPRNAARGAFYQPTVAFPLHPASISEDAASLLPSSCAAPWCDSLHSTHAGEAPRTALRARALAGASSLRTTTAQQRIHDGSADQLLALLQTIGELHIALEQERGGASLDMPEEQVVEADRRTASSACCASRRTVECADPAHDRHGRQQTFMFSVGKGILRTSPCFPC